jgi:Icc-related predicted phosphoesterase
MTPVKMQKKLKILAASDIHGDSRIAASLAKKAEKEQVDLVILCGDTLGFFETKNIIKPFKEKNKKVLIIPGNHDSQEETDFVASLYKIKNLHGYSTKYENVGFFGAGGADFGPGILSDNELFKTLKKAHEGIKGIEKKVMITHMHPKGSKSEFSGFEGSTAITKAIKEFKPDVLLHGHIHEAENIEETIDKTRVINVGRKGTILEI